MLWRSYCYDSMENFCGLSALITELFQLVSFASTEQIYFNKTSMIWIYFLVLYFYLLSTGNALADANAVMKDPTA